MKYLWFGIAYIIFQTTFAQEEKLEQVKDKYEPYYEEMNLRMGILLKKDGVYTEERINFLQGNQNKVFNIGSATKTFTAVLILQEMEKGNLKLSDSIGSFLSSIPNIDGTVTIEQLLRHQTGFGEIVGDQEWDAYDDPDDQLFRQDLFRNVPERDTSKIDKFQYTNTNFILLGEILEKVNDESYFELLKKRIFEPCSMYNSYPYVSRTIPNLVHPTNEKEYKDVYSGINYKFFANYAFAAGSIASSLEDMVRFYEHLYEKETLLSKETFALMIDFKNGSYGLGIEKLVVNGKTFIGHGGNNQGYAYRNYYNPENGDMVLYYNNRFRTVLKNVLLADLMDLLNGRAITDFRKDIAKEFSGFVGEYKLEGPNLKFSIKRENDILFLTAEGFKAPLVSYTTGILFDGTSGIGFTKDAANEGQLIFKQAGQELVATKIN